MSPIDCGKQAVLEEHFSGVCEALCSLLFVLLFNAYAYEYACICKLLAIMFQIFLSLLLFSDCSFFFSISVYPCIMDAVSLLFSQLISDDKCF